MLITLSSYCVSTNHGVYRVPDPTTRMGDGEEKKSFDELSNSGLVRRFGRAEVASVRRQQREARGRVRCYPLNSSLLHAGVEVHSFLPSGRHGLKVLFASWCRRCIILWSGSSTSGCTFPSSRCLESWSLHKHVVYDVVDVI